MHGTSDAVSMVTSCAGCLLALAFTRTRFDVEFTAVGYLGYPLNADAWNASKCVSLRVSRGYEA